MCVCLKKQTFFLPLSRAMSSVPKSKTCLRVLLGKAETGPILFLPSLLAAPQEVVLFHPHADKVPVPMKDFILHAERHSYRTEPGKYIKCLLFQTLELQREFGF